MNRRPTDRDRYGDYRVISCHAHGGDALRVTVEHVITGEREYRVIPLP